MENGKGYPKTIWINFGRTIEVEENNLKAFSDFAEQILEEMLNNINIHFEVTIMIDLKAKNTILNINRIIKIILFIDF